MTATQPLTAPKIRVMLVDDSSIIRGLVSRALTADPVIEIVAQAENGKMAVELAKQHRPDIVILDIEMPEMDGIAALPLIKVAAPNTKIIMASTLTVRNAGISIEALSKGASDYLAKPSAQDTKALETFYRDLLAKIKALASPTAPHATASRISLRPVTTNKIHAIAIASSTGGPQALLSLFGALKGKIPHLPVFITQHMPATFTTILAQHISTASGKICTEGKEGEIVQNGRVYVAPGNYHMVATRKGTDVIIHTNQQPEVNYCRPAADPMFATLSDIYGTGLLAVVLTGMGQDGMEGARKIVEHGGAVISQDEPSCVVYGMPKAVAEAGLCQAVLPLSGVADYLVKRCT